MDRSYAAAEQIALVTTLVIGGVALLSIASFPSWELRMVVLGSELDLGRLLTGRTIVVALLVALTAAGVDALVRTVPELAGVSVRYTATTWILPCLVTFAAATVVPARVGSARNWTISLLLLGALLLSVVVASYGTVLPSHRLHRAARVGLNVATYVAAFALYQYLYGLQVRSLLSATAVVAVTFPLALELLRGTQEQVETTWLYAGVIALVLGELTWVLNAWGLSALTGGAALSIAFYALGGMSQQHLAGRLNRQVVTEFAFVILVGLLAVWLSTPWLSG